MESVITSHHGHFRPASERIIKNVELAAYLHRALAKVKTMFTPVSKEERYLSMATDHGDLEHRMREVMREGWTITYLRW